MRQSHRVESMVTRFQSKQMLPAVLDQLPVSGLHLLSCCLRNPLHLLKIWFISHHAFHTWPPMLYAAAVAGLHSYLFSGGALCSSAFASRKFSALPFGSDSSLVEGSTACPLLSLSSSPIRVTHPPPCFPVVRPSPPPPLRCGVCVCVFVSDCINFRF